MKEEWANLREYGSLAEARASIEAFVLDACNRKRPHSALGYLTPEAFAEQLSEGGEGLTNFGRKAPPYRCDQVPGVVTVTLTPPAWRALAVTGGKVLGHLLFEHLLYDRLHSLADTPAYLQSEVRPAGEAPWSTLEVLPASFETSGLAHGIRDITAGAVSVGSGCHRES